ncbi:PEP-CTERM sorting domain-containing protein [bacterium]|nr:PEP-CTERM sorting domain-containing protein [bacterium]
MKTQRNTRILLAAIAALGLSAQSVFAAAYTLTPGGTQDWNTPATWGGGGSPGTAAGDIANVTGDFGGVSQTVNISTTLANPLTTLLTLGDTNATPGATTIGSSGGSLNLNGTTINSGGTIGAVNTISAPILLTTGGVTFASAVGSTVPSNNPLTITGKITTSAAASRTIENDSSKTVTLGDIDISTGSTTAVLTIRSGTTSTATIGSNFILNGTIADGSSVASALTLGARSGTATSQTSIQVNGTNTYTGNTILGVQNNVVTYFKINSDQPFGPAASGNIAFGGNTSGTAISYFEAIGGDRTITKNAGVLARAIGFNGSNNITLASSTITGSNTHTITNDITATGKVATIGTAGGVYNLNNNATDLTRTKTFLGAGTTIIASGINDNSGTVPTASRMYLLQSGTGKLVFTGNNAAQGAARITTTGTVQIGNGGTTGAIAPSNGIAAVVNGTGTGGTLAFNRSDATAQSVVANGPIGIAQIGAGAVTLSNSQFNSGANQVGDGVSASKLIVSGSVVNSSSTATNATIANSTTVSTVTLNGADTVAGLNLKAGQPVWLASGAANTLAYIDSFTDATHFTVSGGTLLTAGSQALSFGAGSALGTSAATTTVKNLSTLAGTGSIAGSVNVLSGGRLAPGANSFDADSSGRGNFGVAATLSTGALSLTSANLDFDLAATAAGTSDLLNAGSSAVSFSGLSFSFNALTAGTLQEGSSYHLIASSGSFTGDAGSISTTFVSGLSGYVPTYSVTGSGLDVSFAAVPEPASAGLLVGMATLGGFLIRRRRKTQA